jgi:hypothetical protein
MKFFDAVKLWNAKQDNGKWCVPRKGTKEHAEVMAMMKPEVKAPVKPLPSVKSGPKNEIVKTIEKPKEQPKEQPKKQPAIDPNEIIDTANYYLKNYKTAKKFKELMATSAFDGKDLCMSMYFVGLAANDPKQMPKIFSAEQVKELASMGPKFDKLKHITKYWLDSCKAKLAGKGKFLIRGGYNYAEGFNQLFGQLGTASDIVGAVAPGTAFSNILAGLTAANDLRMATGQILRNKVLPGANLKNSPVGAVLSKFGF